MDHQSCVTGMIGECHDMAEAWMRDMNAKIQVMNFIKDLTKIPDITPTMLLTVHMWMATSRDEIHTEIRKSGMVRYKLERTLAHARVIRHPTQALSNAIAHSETLLRAIGVILMQKVPQAIA